jgi:hypothetical protein
MFLGRELDKSIIDQVLICTKSGSKYFTEGREYPIIDYYYADGIVVIPDDEGDKSEFCDSELEHLKRSFKWKEKLPVINYQLKTTAPQRKKLAKELRDKLKEVNNTLDTLADAGIKCSLSKIDIEDVQITYQSPVEEL